MTRPLSLKTEKNVRPSLQCAKLVSLLKIPLLCFPNWSVCLHVNLAVSQYVQNFKILCRISPLVPDD